MEKQPISRLMNGRIPAHTECPFKNICTYSCHHVGVQHLVPFSCAMARLFDLDMRRRDEKIESGKNPQLTGHWLTEATAA